MNALRKPALIGVLMAVAMLFVGVPSLVSMPEYDSVETYYSDATLTTPVGHTFYMCHSTWWDGDWSEYMNLTIYNDCYTHEPDSRGEHYWGADWNCNNGWDDDGDGWADDNDPDCEGI